MTMVNNVHARLVPDAAELLCTTVVQPRKLVHCPMNNGRTVENRIGRGREAAREMELNFSLLSSFQFLSLAAAVQSIQSSSFSIVHSALNSNPRTE